ncbi:hypothetical protein [Halosimplex pelagicum]|uniref:Uncharacterized protein n=1 Tax=Halosimplex pelagicum TaxID=869886 RepID=A0A7D5PE58_9EURY|nr:hypothetical protein [Halosimplex pelagicum]QLH81760.1 hypothetical protein HZS54_09030 [Halosimplex pelagicum]
MERFGSLRRGGRANAAVAWASVGALVAVAAASALAGDLPWSLLALALAVPVAAPAVAAREPTATVPWAIAVVSAAAAAGPWVGVPAEIAGYLAVAAFATAAVVDLVAFTSVELSRGFAAVSVALTTMAAQAVWTVAQFYSDAWLGTGYLGSKTELQWDLVAATAVAVAAGVAFRWYAERFEDPRSTDRSARSGST